eukprot:scaffold1690_cov182-Amphora_coffeaeformis.AAC.43
MQSAIQHDLRGWPCSANGGRCGSCCAWRQFASSAYASSTSAKMIPVEVVDVAASNIAQNANLVATAAGDFGGYAYPVVGIGFLAAFILYLSPPLADE